MEQYRLLGRGDTTFDRSVGREDFEDLPLALPPLEGQRRIAQFLDDQVALLDRAIDLRVSQEALLSEMRISDLSHDLAAPATDGTRSERAYTWLAASKFPLVKLGYVCDLQSGVTVNAGRGSGSTYPYLRVANVQDGWVSLHEVKTIEVSPPQAARSRLRTGDVLMTEGGDLDKLGRGTVWHGQIADCLHQNHIFALRPHVDRLLPDFLALMTRTHHARCYFESTGNRTTNLASTNSHKIMAFRFPLPPLVEQRALVRLPGTCERTPEPPDFTSAGTQTGDHHRCGDRPVRRDDRD
jgi:type I restriction enzyme, S subunit